MHKQIVVIRAVPVYVNEHCGGELRIWHPMDPSVHQIIDALCRGKGEWMAEAQYWIIERG